MSKKPEQPSVEFLEAGRLYARLRDAGLAHSPEAAEALSRMHAAALELLPDVPDGYTDEGKPAYKLETLVERLGITPREAARAAEDMGIKPNAVNLNRVH